MTNRRFVRLIVIEKAAINQVCQDITKSKFMEAFGMGKDLSKMTLEELSLVPDSILLAH